MKRPTPHSESIWCPHCGEEFGIESKVEDEREAQAEISFPAGEKQGYEKGFKAGEEQGYVRGFDAAESTMIPRATEDGKQAEIREVVEWMEVNSHTSINDDGSGGGIRWRSMANMCWQAQLKKWGIDKGGKR